MSPTVRGDAEAHALFDAHIGIAERMARSYSRRLPWLDVNELRAFAFFGLFDAARRFERRDESSSFVHYAHARVRGAIRDGLRSLEWFERRNARRAARKDGSVVHTWPLYDFDLEGLVDASPLVDERLDAKNRWLILRHALKRLPERERDMLQRHYFDGVPFDQMAQEQGVSPARISQLKRRAFSRLMEILNGKPDCMERD